MPSPQSGQSDPQSGQSEKIWQSSLVGAASGVVGRLSTNNLTQMTAHFQSGRFRPDFSLVTMRGMLLGANFQVATTFGCKTALGCREEDPLTPQKCLKYFTAGALGRLATHPSAVAFFMDKSSPTKHALFPELKQIKAIYKADPRIFLRGLPVGMIFSGLDWLLYLCLREKLGETGAATISIGCTTPFYQWYISSIRNEQVKVTSIPLVKIVKSIGAEIKFSSSDKRALISNALYNLIAIFERMMMGKTATYLNKALDDEHWTG